MGQLYIPEVKLFSENFRLPRTPQKPKFRGRGDQGGKNQNVKVNSSTLPLLRVSTWYHPSCVRSMGQGRFKCQKSIYFQKKRSRGPSKAQFWGRGDRVGKIQEFKVGSVHLPLLQASSGHHPGCLRSMGQGRFICQKWNYVQNSAPQGA